MRRSYYKIFQLPRFTKFLTYETIAFNENTHFDEVERASASVEYRVPKNEERTNLTDL